MIAEFFPLFYFYTTVKLYPPPAKNCQVFSLNLCKIIYFFVLFRFLLIQNSNFVCFSVFTFSLQNLNLYHSPHISLKIKYKNSLSQPFEESGGYKINFFLGGELSKHLAEIDQACNERMEIIVSAMSEQEGVTEALKASDQME